MLQYVLTFPTFHRGWSLQKMAETDLVRIEKYKSIIVKVARAKQMAAVIAAIISRESRAGSVLKDGWGDHGNGFGLMQVGQKNWFLYFKISWESWD